MNSCQLFGIEAPWEIVVYSQSGEWLEVDDGRLTLLDLTAR